MNEPINTFAPELEPLTQRLYKLLFAGGINSARVDTNYLTQETNIDLIRIALQTAYELGIGMIAEANADKGHRCVVLGTCDGKCLK